MADSSLVGVIVGGIIGIAGGVIGPLVLEWRKGISDNRKRRQDRLIELIYAIYEHHHWIQHLYEIKVKGETGEISPTPYAKIEAISHVYFPQLDTLVNNLALAATSYQEFILRNAPVLQQLDLSKESHVPIHADFVQERADYVRSGNILLDELKAYAKREFQ